MTTREEELFAIALDIALGRMVDDEDMEYLVERECLRRRQSETMKRVWAARKARRKQR